MAKKRRVKMSLSSPFLSWISQKGFPLQCCFLRPKVLRISFDMKKHCWAQTQFEIYCYGLPFRINKYSNFADPKMTNARELASQCIRRRERQKTGLVIKILRFHSQSRKRHDSRIFFLFRRAADVHDCVDDKHCLITSHFKWLKDNNFPIGSN